MSTPAIAQVSRPSTSHQAPRSHQGSRGDVKWEICKSFEEAGLKVVIKKLAIFRPRYSFNVGSGTGEGVFSPHLSLQVNLENGMAELTTGIDILALGRLVASAQTWILEAMQDREDQIIREKQNKERQAMAKSSGPTSAHKVRDPGKTEREAAKRAKHLQNLEARRQQDQERTQACKSGKKV